MKQMSTELVEAIKLLQVRLNKGDQITIKSDEFCVALDGATPTAYVTEVEDDNQLEFNL
jgi:hypothetical protein